MASRGTMLTSTRCKGISVFLLVITIIWILHSGMYPFGDPDFEENSIGPVLYNMSQPVAGRKVKCSQLKTHPNVHICGHGMGDFLSSLYITGQSWEIQFVNIMESVIKSDKDMGVIDIGSNLGYYGLIAASMGHKVLAVEPLHMNVLRIHKSAILAGTEKNMILIQRALSNIRETKQIVYPMDNKGAATLRFKCGQIGSYKCAAIQTILLDDLLQYIPFKKAFVKFDIEGNEPLAIQNTSKFFHQIDVPYILMELQVVKRVCLDVDNFPSSVNKKQKVQKMLDTLKGWDYKAYNPYTQIELDYANCTKWPNDVVWAKNGKPLPWKPMPEES